MGNKGNGSAFTRRLTDFLQNVDFRLATEQGDRDDLFRLRYDCYRREGAIEANSEEMFHDDYDAMENCWLFGMFIDEKLVASVRIHITTPQCREGPAHDVFPDVIWPMLDRGLSFIDPTRMVIEESASKRFPQLPFATIRCAIMAAEYFDADIILATVRKEHQAFYKRYFGCNVLSEPRPYPTLLKPISLLATSAPVFREELMTRYPMYMSTLTERRLLFGPGEGEQRLSQSGGILREAYRRLDAVEDFEQWRLAAPNSRLAS